MSEYIKKSQEKLEQTLREVDDKTSLYVELSDQEIVDIIGGAYLKAAVEFRLKFNAEECIIWDIEDGDVRP